MTKKKRVYKIIFYNEGKLYEIYAQQVFQGNLYGFVEVEQLLFGENASLVVDPSEERLKAEFNGVKRTYIPMHTIVRIDEVEKEGAAKITMPETKSGNITAFPTTVYTPSSDTRKT